MRTWVIECPCGEQFPDLLSGDPFFLPDFCPNCGDECPRHAGKYSDLGRGWRRFAGCYVGDAVWWKPWTWLRGHYEMDDSINGDSK
jgi:hypothetical protein